MMHARWSLRDIPNRLRLTVPSALILFRRRRGPFHDQHDRSVHNSLQVVQRVLDVLDLSDLARPAPAGKLPGRVRRNTLGIREKGDLLQALLQFLPGADRIAQGRERADEGVW